MTGRSPECRRILSETLECLDNLRTIEVEVQESMDPTDVAPRSRLCRWLGSTNGRGGRSQSGQPMRRKLYVCNIGK
jgi:hypothetical protein